VLQYVKLELKAVTCILPPKTILELENN